MVSGIEDVDVASSAIRSGAVAFIKKNENSYLRVQNQVKYIISQKSLDRSKQHNKMARVVFVASMVVLAAFAVLVFFTDYL
jgi:FixJ family two-component response regulator